MEASGDHLGAERMVSMIGHLLRRRAEETRVDALRAITLRNENFLNEEHVGTYRILGESGAFEEADRLFEMFLRGPRTEGRRRRPWNSMR